MRFLGGNLDQQNKKTFFKRFWWLLLLIVLIMVAVIFATSGRGNNQNNNQQQTQTKDDSPPVLKNLGVEFAPFDAATNHAGDFKFVDQGELKTIFFEFGAIIGKGEQYEHINPTFEYDTDPNASIKAVADGVIVDAKYQEDTKDWEIFTSPSNNSKWIVSYDHVLNPAFKKGDKVTAGQKLGTVGTWTNGLGRVEITVSKSEGQKYYSYCPFNYFDPSLKAEYQQKVSRLMSDYESWKKDASIFDEEKEKVPGCLYNSVVEEEGGNGAKPVE